MTRVRVAPMAVAAVLVASSVGADILVVDRAGEHGLERRAGIDVGSTRVPIYVGPSDQAAREAPSLELRSLADCVRGHGFELAGPIEGRIEVQGDKLLSVDLRLDLERQQEEDAESEPVLFRAFVTGRPDDSGAVVLVVRGFSMSNQTGEPDFVGTFRAWME